MKTCLPLLLLAALCACPAPLPAPGSGLEDSGVVTGEDAGPGDAGATPDAGPAPDAGPPAPAAFTFRVTRGGAAVTVDQIVYGEQVTVALSGLPPSSEVVVRCKANAYGAQSRGYASWARFAVPASGSLDLSAAAPLEGTYGGADADGLIWSMVEGPRPDGLGSNPFSLYLSVERQGQPLATAELPRLAAPPGTQRIPVSANGLVGVLYLPPGAGKRAPVIAFGGSEGGLYTGESLAATAATWGHPALGLAYFGERGLPAELKSIPLEYFQTAVAYLKTRPEVDTSRLAVMGASRGGELALLLGAYLPEVTAVVAWEPSVYVWGAYASTPGPAWTWQGAPLPSVPRSAAAQVAVVPGPGGEDAYSTLSAFLAHVNDAPPAALEAAAIPLEKAKGPVLLLGGADDQVWQSCAFVEKGLQRLAAKGHSTLYADEGRCFPAAGHNLTFVGGPTTDALFLYSAFAQGWYAFGGTPAGVAKAQREADTRVRDFLGKHLALP